MGGVGGQVDRERRAEKGKKAGRGGGGRGLRSLEYKSHELGARSGGYYVRCVPALT